MTLSPAFSLVVRTTLSAESLPMSSVATLPKGEPAMAQTPRCHGGYRGTGRRLHAPSRMLVCLHRLRVTSAMMMAA